MNALTRAIQNCTPKTQAELARRIRKNPQEVNRWVKRGFCSPKAAPAIESATGVPTNELIADSHS